MLFQKCMTYFLLWNMKENILSSLSIQLRSMGTNIVWLPMFFKIPSFVFRREKEMHLERHEGEKLMTKFTFLSGQSL